jgi:lysine-specific demethylase 8
MSGREGPEFRLVDTVTLEEFERQGGLVASNKPFLVRGGVTNWPAWETWSFEHFARLARQARRSVMATFQNGLIEQGDTQPPIEQPLEPYVRQLGQESATAASGRPDIGLCPDRVLATLQPGDAFRLDWGYLESFRPNKVYLGQWDILRAFPQLKLDLRLERMWRRRRNYPFIWIGPANTVTGLHTDYPDNWFCQFCGEKEFLLFPAAEDRFLSPSSKYDFGARLSRIDIMGLANGGPETQLFAEAQGIYARVRPGDAMFVPRNTWHCVVALEPAISLSVFGLTVADMVLQGPRRIGLDVLHNFGMYRRGNCTCHGAKTGRYG